VILRLESTGLDKPTVGPMLQCLVFGGFTA
jgi:hypothetical protein